ncbi:MAG: sensor histidine kinase [Anaerolineae bacterium]
MESLGKLRQYRSEIVDAWLDALGRTNPVLQQETLHPRAEELADEVIELLTAKTLDIRRARAVGESLEEIDSCQPEDLVRIQETLAQTLLDSLGSGGGDAHTLAQQRVSRFLFALGAGFFSGKAKRASRLGMASMSRMSHDFKTPINTVTGFSRVMLKGVDGPITDFQREDLTSIYEAGSKLLRMVDDLFAVRKLDQARTWIYDAPFEVSELMADIVRTAQPIVADYDTTLELRLAGDLGTLDLDASMVRWVLLGVLAYMMRSTHGRSVSLTAGRDVVNPSTLVFEIARRESGASEARRRVENPEWPDDMTLTTSRRFCEQLGGTISRSVTDVELITVRLPTADARA